jgi:4-carboxymuconolactone decarboxylase
MNAQQIMPEEVRAGYEVLNALDPDVARSVVESLAHVAPDLAQLVVGYGFGVSYARPALASRDRQLVSLGVLTALGADRQVPLHVRLALRAGLSPEEIVESFIHSAVYAGFPRAINAVLAASPVLIQEREGGES